MSLHRPKFLIATKWWQNFRAQEISPIVCTIIVQIQPSHSLSIEYGWALHGVCRNVKIGKIGGVRSSSAISSSNSWTLSSVSAVRSSFWWWKRFCSWRVRTSFWRNDSNRSANSLVLSWHMSSTTLLSHGWWKQFCPWKIHSSFWWVVPIRSVKSLILSWRISSSTSFMLYKGPSFCLYISQM